MKRIDLVTALESEIPEVPATETPAEGVLVEVPVAEAPAEVPAEPVVAEVAEVPASEVPAEAGAEAPAVEIPAAEVPAEEPPAEVVVAEVPAETPAEVADVPAADESVVEMPAEDPPVVDEVPVNDEDDCGFDSEEAVGDVAEADAKTTELVSEMETESVALEAISMYASNLEYLIATKTCSLEALDIINFGVQQELNRLGAALPVVSLESDATIEQRSQVALEGIRDVWKRIAQAYILSMKHMHMIRSESRMSIINLVKNYTKKNAEAHTEFSAEKGKWKDAKHKGSLVALWYHFSTDKGQTPNVLEAVAKDMLLSKYLLTKYPADIIALYEKALGFFQSTKITDLKSAAAFAKRFESLTHPFDLFDKHFLVHGKPYLSVTGLEISQGTARNPIAIGTVSLKKLAELATPRTVVESWSAKHAFNKIIQQAGAETVANGAAVVAGSAALRATASMGAAVVGAGVGAALGGSVALAATGKSLELTAAEIGKLFDYADEYVHNVEAYIAHSKKMNQTADLLVVAYTHLLENIPETLSKEEVNQIRQLTKQVAQFCSNIEQCFDKPALKEVERTMKGSKYCRYLGLRMIANAK